jgi:hypothetical protein
MLFVESVKKFEFKFQFEQHFAYKPICFLRNSLKLLWRYLSF